MTGMAYCPKCSGKMEVTQRLCPNCGYDFLPIPIRHTSHWSLGKMGTMMGIALIMVLAVAIILRTPKLASVKTDVPEREIPCKGSEKTKSACEMSAGRQKQLHDTIRSQAADMQKKFLVTTDFGERYNRLPQRGLI